jgi:hypothetical protein
MSENYLSEIADQLKNQTPPESSQVNSAPVETPIEQAPVETTAPEVVETKAVETPAEQPVEKQWWEEEDKVITSETKTVVPAPEEKPQFDLDDDLKLLMEYKKSGKTLQDFISEYKVEDISNWSDEQIVKNGIKEFMGLIGDELDQAVYEFENASIFQKKQWADSFKQQYVKKNEDKLKQLTSSNTQRAEYENAVAQKYNAELDSFSQQVVGQELYGMKITDEMSKDLKNFIDKEFTLQKEDGSFDIEKMYSIGLWLKYGKDLMKANITKAKNEGREQIIKEVSNPSKNMTGLGRTVGSGLEAAQEAFNTLFQS